MDILTPEIAPQTGPWLVLGLASAAIIGLTAFAGRLLRSALWQRTLWQAATLGLLVLVLLEATGVAPALVQVCRRAVSREVCKLATPPGATDPSPLGERGKRPAAPFAVETSIQSNVFDREPPDEPAVSRERVFSPGEARGVPARTTITLPGLTAVEETIQGLTPPALNCRRSAAGPLPFATLGSVDSHPAPGPDLPAAPGWLEALWLIGVLVLAGRAAWARLLLARFRRRCRPVCDAAVLGCVERLAGRLGVRQPIRVLAAEGLVAPVVFGSFRPAIVVPARFHRDFDPGQREAVLAHEVAHLAARDPAWQCVAGLVCALLWWQPLAWWSRRRLRAAREAVADEASLLLPDGPGLLAASLVAVGRRLLRSNEEKGDSPHLCEAPFGPFRQMGTVPFFREGDGFRSGLGRRVERLMKLRSPGHGPGREHGRACGACGKALLTLAAALVAISCTAWAQPQAPSLDEGGTTMSVLRTSWRCSLAATALWALAAPSGTAADTPPSRPEKPAVEKSAPAPAPSARETRRDDSRGPSDEVAKQRQKIQDELRAIRAKVEGRDVSDADRKALREKAQKLYEQLRALPGGPGERVRGEASRPVSEEVMKQRERLQGEIKMLRGKLDELKDAPEEARRDVRAAIQSRYERLQSLAGGPAGQRPGGPGRPEARGDMEGQMRHLQAAAENLRAAGMPDVADMILRRAERVREGAAPGGPREAGPPREGARPERGGPSGPPREAGPPREGARPERGGPSGPPREGVRPGREGPAGPPREGPRGNPPAAGEIGELRSQVQQMHQEVQELRELLRRFMEKQSGDRRPERAPAPAGDSGRR